MILNVMLVLIMIFSKKKFKKQLGKQPIDIKLRRFTFFGLLVLFDATFLYPSAMWDEKSENFKIETGCDLTSENKDKIV